MSLCFWMRRSHAQTLHRTNICLGIFREKSGDTKIDGLVKSQKINLLPQYIGHNKSYNTICCGQNEKLGLFTSTSRLVAKQKSDMNTRGVLNSTMTLQAVADFFSAEFTVRCDFLKNFIVSHDNLLSQDSDADVVTVAKMTFQTISFEERDKMKALYKTSVMSIVESLSNDNMKKQIEEVFVAKMEYRIKKNNLYVEIAYQGITAAKANQNRALILQPNFYGIRVDLVELWNRYVKHN